MTDVVVITGGTAGVGRAVAQRFARDGYRLAILARDGERLGLTAAELVRLGATDVLPIGCDVADADAVTTAAAQVIAHFGAIDIWVNNAMTTVFSEFTDITSAEFQRVTEVVYGGVVNGTRAALQHMVPRDTGTIVQVGSALAWQGIPLQSAYCGAKHAARGFTESVRAELMHKKSNVRITTVELPAMNTPQFSWCRSHLDAHPQPVPPIYQPEVAARAVHWAARHPQRSRLLVGWPTVLTVFGSRLSPALATRYVANRAWDAQFARDRGPRTRGDNLFQPVPGDPGTHGTFDKDAKDSSAVLDMSLHSRALTSATAVGAYVTRRRSRRAAAHGHSA